MKQHNTPCGGCPFYRKCEKGALGGSPPEVYVGQIVMPFWLPCHQSQNYRGKSSDVNEVSECAGAAIMRANIGVQPRAPLLALPPNKELVFATFAEFYEHHTDGEITKEQAEEMLTPERVTEMALEQWHNAQVRVQMKRRD